MEATSETNKDCDSWEWDGFALAETLNYEDLDIVFWVNYFSLLSPFGYHFKLMMELNWDVKQIYIFNYEKVTCGCQTYIFYILYSLNFLMIYFEIHI